MLVADWRPGYEIERRTPAFLDDEEDQLGIGLFL